MAQNTTVLLVFVVERVIGQRINNVTGKTHFPLKLEGYPE